MAFTVKTLRVLCKVYNGSKIATYSTLRPPVERITFVRAAQKFCYSTEPSKPKIPGFSNLQSSVNPSLTQTVSEQNTENEQDEDAQRKEEERQRQWRMMKYSFIFFGVSMGLMGTYLVYELGRPNYDENGNVIEDEFTHMPYFKQLYHRLYKEINYYKKFVQEPSREKLLPDPLKDPYFQPPYTIVLEVKDLLEHPVWKLETGWRFKKRPWVDYLLETIAPPQFETVVYTAEQGMTVFPLLDAMDPNGYIMYRLVRDATRFVNGHHVKDLDALNRDLSKVIVVDWDPESVKFHPENLLKIPRWTGNDDDTTLYDLAAFLKTIHDTKVEDVRDVLAYYKQFENPLEAFRENQRKLLLQMEEQEIKAQQQQQQSKVSGTTWKPSFLKNR